MSVSIQTVEFERREAHLSELEDGPPFTVHGVALGNDDVTVGQSGIKKLWPAEELEKAAESLEGRNLVVDHNNESDGVVGQVTKAGYKDDAGVIYEAELFDEKLADKIDNGLLEVSIRGKHIDVDEMEEAEDGAKIVEGIKFANLSIVPTGAAPSNSIEMGETEELSVAELSAFTDDLGAAELQEIEPGLWVKSDGTKGITIGAVEDGEIEVDIYEKSDGKWRSTGETEMYDTDSLTEWDVDEEEDIGPRQDDEEEAAASEELQSMHEPDWDSTTTAEWEAPDLEDFTDESWEDMSGDMREEISNSFLVSKTGEFPPERFSDLALPVVSAEGDLNLNALRAAKARAGQVEEVSEEDEEQLNEMIDMLANDNFEDAVFGEDEEEASSTELQDWQSHSPDFSGTTTDSWDAPDMEDFDTDDLSEIDDHFLISATGFPPDNFTDLALPVVEPNGDLNLNALQAAKGGRGVSAVEGLDSEMEDEVTGMINSLANDNFEEAEFGDGEEARAHRGRTIDDTGDEPEVQDTGPIDIALQMINKYLTIEGNHERDSVDNMLSWLMGSVDIPMETLGDFRMAASRFLDETPGTDSFSAMTVEQFRDWLHLHGKESQGRREQDERDRMPRNELSSVNVLTGDDFQHSADKTGESELDDITTKVINMTEEIEQKLAELSEPVAVEQSDLEELQDKADRFGEMSDTLESLKERTDILDDVDRSAVEELADSDEPVVVESTRMESLEGEAEQVKTVYAAALSDEMEAFSGEELADRFSIEELREKYEEQIGDPAEELTSSEDAEPRSGDVDEEELEERAEEESEEELEGSETDEAEEMREKLRSNILG